MSNRRSSSNGCLSVLVGIALVLPLIGQGICATYKTVTFNRNVTGYLKLAADANSVALAQERLNRAIGYIEEHGYTHGFTSVLWTTPQQNVREWYRNLKDAQHNLANFPTTHTEADTSTALVKLRETILDHGADGDTVTKPGGISVFPHNVLWAWMWAGTGFSGVIGVLIAIGGNHRYY